MQDSAGQENNVSQTFSVSGDPADLQLIPSLLILTHFQPLVRRHYLE